MDELKDLKSSIGKKTVIKSRGSLVSLGDSEIAAGDVNGDNNKSHFSSSGLDSARSRSLDRCPSLLGRLNSKLKLIKDKSEGRES